MTSQFSSNVFASAVEPLYIVHRTSMLKQHLLEGISVSSNAYSNNILKVLKTKGRLCGFHFTLDYRGIN